MINRHHGQVFACHFGNQTAPKPGTNHNVIGLYGAAFRANSGDAAVFADQFKCRCIAKGRQFTRCNRLIDQLSGNGLRTRRNKAGIRVPHGTLYLVFFQKREFFLGFSRADDFDIGAKGLAGIYPAFEFGHAFIIANPGDFDPANAGVMAHLFVKIYGIHRCPARQKIVAGGKAKIRRMCG